MTLETSHLELGYGSTVVISDLSYTVPEGRITSLVGRNGCGKSTLLRAMGRLSRPRGGAVLLDGRSIAETPPRELARKLAILPQSPSAPEGMTVGELVRHGRYPHRHLLGLESAEDRRVIAWALEQTGMADLADRPLDRLSGGQRQRAWIALALAQNTGIVLLDEPTTYLDVAYQLELMELLRTLNAEHGTTILMVLHDLNQAARFSHELVAVRGGTVYASGPPAEVLTERMVRDVFGLESDITADPRTGSPLCLPYALARAEGTPKESADRPDDAADTAGADRPVSSGVGA